MLSMEMAVIWPFGKAGAYVLTSDTEHLPHHIYLNTVVPGLSVAKYTIFDDGIAFYIFDYIKLIVLERNSKRRAQQRQIAALSLFEAMWIGAVAKAIGVAITFPIRVAKMITQSQSTKDTEKNGGTIFGVWRGVLADRGLMGLYDGIAADVASCSVKVSFRLGS